MVESSNSGRLWPSIYEPFARAGARLSEWLTPASDASSDTNAYHISVELPGVAEEDVTIDVHDGVLSLKGQKHGEREEKGETWYFRERLYGSFSRNYLLPPDADGDNTKATLKDGVLTITVPKTPVDSGKKQVKISKR